MPDLKRAERYHWFQGASVQQLFDQLEEYGPGTARLEVHQRGDEMHLRVIADDGSELPPIDESRVCPPICP